MRWNCWETRSRCPALRISPIFSSGTWRGKSSKKNIGWNINGWNSWRFGWFVELSQSFSLQKFSRENHKKGMGLIALCWSCANTSWEIADSEHKVSYHSGHLFVEQIDINLFMRPRFYAAHHHQETIWTGHEKIHSIHSKDGSPRTEF